EGIWLLHYSGTTRSFAFCRYMTAEAAQVAVTKLNNYQIRTTVQLGVVPSMDNRRLYVCGLPTNRTCDEVTAELTKVRA
ncbi:MAG TPA: hypothetical protein VK145_00915, partial [Candidatus Nanoarchaeia archaeon]|nr:hypothetical protein [Candidatus Nanoarchaeia archaeon]